MEDSENISFIEKENFEDFWKTFFKDIYNRFALLLVERYISYDQKRNEWLKANLNACNQRAMDLILGDYIFLRDKLRPKFFPVTYENHLMDRYKVASLILLSSLNEEIFNLNLDKFPYVNNLDGTRHPWNYSYSKDSDITFSDLFAWCASNTIIGKYYGKNETNNYQFGNTNFLPCMDGDSSRYLKDFCYLLTKIRKMNSWKLFFLKKGSVITDESTDDLLVLVKLLSLQFRTLEKIVVFKYNMSKGPSFPI